MPFRPISVTGGQQAPEPAKAPLAKTLRDQIVQLAAGAQRQERAGTGSTLKAQPGQKRESFTTPKITEQEAQQFSKTTKGQAAGFLKSFLNTLVGGSELIQQAVSPITEAVTGSAIEATPETRPEALKKITQPREGEEGGFLVGEIAQFFLPTPLSKEKAVTNAPKIIKPIFNVFKNNPTLAKAFKSGAGFGALTAAQEGEFGTEAKISTALGAVTPFLAKPFQALKEFTFKRTIPTTITQSAKDFAKNLNIGQAVSETGVSFSRGQLINKLEKRIQKFGTRLESVFEQAVKDNPGKTYKLAEISQGIKDKIFNDPKLIKSLKATPIDIPKVGEVVDDVILEYNKLFPGPLTAKQLQALKVDLSKGLESEFDRAIGATFKAKPLTEMQLRKGIQTLLEKEVPAAKAINQKLAPLLEASKRINKKGGYSGYLTDLLAGGFAAGGAQEALSDPGKFVENFIKGVLLKRAGTSTAAKTAAGTLAGQVEKLLSKPQVSQGLAKLLDAKFN